MLGKGNDGLMPSQELLEPVVGEAILAQNAIPWQLQRCTKGKGSRKGVCLKIACNTVLHNNVVYYTENYVSLY